MARAGMVGYSKWVVSRCDNGDGTEEWDCVRGGSSFATFDKRENAQAECDTLNSQEDELWGMTPEERVAILSDSKHDLYSLARFLSGKFPNFRTFRRRGK